MAAIVRNDFMGTTDWNTIEFGAKDTFFEF